MLAGRGDRGRRGGRSSSAQRPALHRPRTAAVDRAAGRRVAEAGDLRLVRHQPDQAEAGPGGDRARPARRRPRPSAAASGARRRGRAGRAGARRRRGRGRPAAPGRRVGRDDRVDEVELVDAVDHERDRGGAAARTAASSAQRGPVGGRVADQDVVADARSRRSQIASGSVYAITPCQPGRASTSREHLAAAHRLAGDPDRLAGGPVRPARRRWRRRRRRRPPRTAGRGRAVAAVEPRCAGVGVRSHLCGAAQPRRRRRALRQSVLVVSRVHACTVALERSNAKDLRVNATGPSRRTRGGSAGGVAETRASSGSPDQDRRDA